MGNHPSIPRGESLGIRRQEVKEWMRGRDGGRVGFSSFIPRRYGDFYKAFIDSFRIVVFLFIAPSGRQKRQK